MATLPRHMSLAVVPLPLFPLPVLMSDLSEAKAAAPEAGEDEDEGEGRSRTSLEELTASMSCEDHWARLMYKKLNLVVQG